MSRPIPWTVRHSGGSLWMSMEDKTQSDGLLMRGWLELISSCVAQRGSTDIRLYASHKQFPVALSQFLIKVQAEHWKCRVVLMDTHSVHISAAVDEVLALFQMQLPPISMRIFSLALKWVI